MNPSKAREFFSAYYEGTLEKGLRESFERLLASDSDTKMDYEFFVQVVSQLDDLRNDPVTPPHDLHERVSAAVDRHIWEQNQVAKPSIWNSWRNWAVAAVAGAALLVAGLQLIPRKQGAVTAGLGSFIPQNEIQVERGSNDELTLKYRTAGTDTVRVELVKSGEELSSFKLENQTLNSALVNHRPEAVLLSIKAGAVAEPLYLALPGKELSQDREGEGTIADLAVALADAYRTPVQLRVKSLRTPTKWQFANSDVVDSASRALAETGFTIVKRRAGVLTIEEN